MGDAPVLRQILVDMGIEEVERDTPDLHLPDRDIDRRVNEGDLNNELLGVIV